MLGGNVLYNVLARVATVVVGRSCQFMLYARVQQHKFVSLGIERIVLKLTAAAIQAHQLSCLSEDACKLVHDTAVHATVVVLRSLSCQYDVPFAYLVLSEEVVQSAGEAALHSSRRRHTGSEGNITCKGNVVSFYGNTQFLHLLRDTVDISCPACTWPVGIAKLEVHAVLQVDGVSHDGIFRSVGTHFCHNATVNGAWENEATIIVRMLANQVDTSWRMIDFSSLPVKMLDESASYEFNFHNSKIYLIKRSLISERQICRPSSAYTARLDAG